MTRVAAVILAGGEGERLGGVNKALLTIAGQRFIDRAVTATSGCDPRLLSVGPAGFEAPGELVQVLDLDTDYGGPLAGLAAAVDYLSSQPIELLFSLAVDSPLLPSDFLARALPMIETADAVIACYGAQDYPTNAVWRLRALDNLPSAVRAGRAPRALKRLAEGLGAARLDYAPLADSDPFRNANTPEDLAFLRREIERHDDG